MGVPGTVQPELHPPRVTRVTRLCVFPLLRRGWVDIFSSTVGETPERVLGDPSLRGAVGVCS